MPSIPEAIGKVKTRLLSLSSLIGAGAVAAVAASPDAGITTAVVVLLQALAGLGSNIVAADLYEVIAKRLNHSDVLHNEDLAHAAGAAICSVIHDEADDPHNNSDKDALTKMSRTAPGTWELLAALRDESLADISEANLPAFFSTDVEDFAVLTALDPPTWHHLLRWLADQEDVYVSDETYDRVAESLYRTFPKALREILKFDFAKGGEAYGGLLLTLVGEIKASQRELLDQTQRILDKTQEIQSEGRTQNVEVVGLLRHIIALITQSGGLQPTASTWLTSKLPPRNQIFTGRRKVLDGLKAELEKSGRAALSGMPGVGKTQTAIEYAHEQYAAQAYRYVFYARAAGETELLADFLSAAQELNLPAKDSADFNLVAAAVKTWLESAENWLLIFDNADDLKVVHQHTPANTKGHVLFTRRPGDAGGVAHTIKIEEMDADEGALLLLRRAAMVKDADTLDAVAPEIAAQARAIAREMDGLPLSLDIAGAFIKETSTRLDEYPGLYREEGKQLRQHLDPNALYEHSVATVFALAFKQVAVPDDDKEESVIIARAAADLLRLCAFLAPDAIPLELILANTYALGEDLQHALGNKIWRKKTVAKATRFSLLDANPRTQTYDMHREVQAVMRDEMDDATQRLWADSALQTLVKVFPDPDDFANWETCDLLLPHAQDCLIHGDRLKVETKAVARLKNQTGFHLDSRARYAEAEPLYVQALQLVKKLLGPEHPNVALGMNNLAALYRAQGRYAEAEPLYVQALELTKKLHGLEHPDVTLGMNNLASLYYFQGRYAEAEPLYVQALELRKKLLGLEHPNVAISMNNLAGLYHAQGRYAEAEPLLVQALELTKKLFGSEHPDVAQITNNLAELYRAQGRYAEAEPLYMQALELRKKLLGLEHPNVATGMNNLAALYHAQGRCAEAEPLLVQALELRKKLLGPEHPNVALGMNNLAALYRAQGRYEEAEPLYVQALTTFEKILGENHPNTITVRENFKGFQREKAVRESQRRNVKVDKETDGD